MDRLIERMDELMEYLEKHEKNIEFTYFWDLHKMMMSVKDAISFMEHDRELYLKIQKIGKFFEDNNLVIWDIK